METNPPPPKCDGSPWRPAADMGTAQPQVYILSQNMEQRVTTYKHSLPSVTGLDPYPSVDLTLLFLHRSRHTVLP